MKRRLTSALLLSTALASGAAAQTPSLVLDIAPGPPASVEGGGTNPHGFAVAGDRAVFFTGGTGSPETRVLLWSTDGTDAGTEVLAAFCVENACLQEPHVVAGLPGLALFTASFFDNDLGTRLQLWSTDGTRAGTVPLTPPLEAFPFPFTSPVIVGRRLFFGACETVPECALWTSDGTPAGTTRVLRRQIVSGITASGNQVYFLARANDGRFETFLWRSDGTTAGTVQVAPLPTGGLGSGLTAAGSRVFFLAGDLDSELWTSDGTRQGTRRLRRFVECDSLFCGRTLGDLKPIGASVVFTARDEVSGPNVWQSDGTPGGTRRLTAFPFTPAPATLPRAGQIVRGPGGRLLFVAGDGITGPRLWTPEGPLTGCRGGCPAVAVGSPLAPLGGGRFLFAAETPRHGTEPWTTDGTPGGTRLLRDLCPGACSSSPAILTPREGRVYFSAEVNGQHGLWRTDGTAAGTTLLGPVRAPSPAPAPPGFVPSNELDLAVVLGSEGINSQVFFAGFDPVHGIQPWVSDGSGASVITAIDAPAASSLPHDLTPVGDRLLFNTEDPDSLWTTRGDAASTLPLPGGAGDHLTAAGGLGFFARDLPQGEGVELWRTDGTAAGTFPVATFRDRTVSRLVEVGGRLFALVSSTIGQKPLYAFWTSDGTAAGTVPAFAPPDDTLGLVDITPLGSELYFVARRESGTEIWRSDGTQAGTRLLLRLPCDCAGLFSPVRFVRVGDHVYFLAWDQGTQVNGPTLWRTDGTPEGTVLTGPSPDGPTIPFFSPQQPFELGGELYFFASTREIDDALRHVLFRGRDAGAAVVAPIGGEPHAFVSPEVVRLNGSAFLRAWDPDHGMELWRIDGTSAEATLVSDLVPGPGSSDPRGLTVAGGRLFFSGTDGVHGRELWTSDGTAAGTRLVADLSPGERSSSPNDFTAAGGRLYFSADDGLHGRELWSLPLAGSSCQPTATRLCLAGGFQVEAIWRDAQGANLPAAARPLSDRAGLFSFFSPDNPEAAVEVVDGRAVNGHVWVFLGGLSNQEYTVTVTDTATGAARRYFNPAGRFGSLGDRQAFGPEGATAGTLTDGPLALASAPVISTPRTAAGFVCIPIAQRLCLGGGRFAIELQKRGDPVRAIAAPIAGTQAGFFWTGDPGLPEVVVKILDGRVVNGHFWVFLAGLTDEAYVVTVTDTATGQVRTYRNRRGRFTSAGDVTGF